MPVLQHMIFDAHGRLLGVVDFYWPGYGVIGEFDGRVKYEKLRKPGESATDVLMREKSQFKM
ncbi:MAG: hypothetical protein U0R21_09955 [Nocardioidaceae bacterium]